MQTLPTFEVSDAQAERLMAVFGNPARYRAWLRRRITEAVHKAEAKERAAKVRDYAASLEPDTSDPFEEPEPPMPDALKPGAET